MASFKAYAKKNNIFLKNQVNKAQRNAALLENK